jgi:hypothetical protein
VFSVGTGDSLEMPGEAGAGLAGPDFDFGGGSSWAVSTELPRAAPQTTVVSQRVPIIRRLKGMFGSGGTITPNFDFLTPNFWSECRNL